MRKAHRRQPIGRGARVASARPSPLGEGEGQADISPVAEPVEGAAMTALGLEATNVVVYSQSGITARLLARYRLPMPIIAVTNVESTYRQLNLSFGVHPIFAPNVTTLSELLEKIDDIILGDQLGAEGDTLVVVSALDGRDGHTDTLHIHRVRA